MKLLLDQLDALITLFKPHCTDTETLNELHVMLRHEKEWPKAHYLFTRIRSKNINALKAGNNRAEAQYWFEEICAQTLHNMSGSKKPFDHDTPYWIIPIALKFAKAVEIDSQKIIEIATS
jgi:hypothetical protein